MGALVATLFWWTAQQAAQNERLRIRQGNLQVLVSCTTPSSPCDDVFVEVGPTLGEDPLLEDRRGPFTITSSEPLSLPLPLMWDGTDCKDILVRAYMVGDSMSKTITLCEGETQDVVLQLAG